jgi:predicted nucleic acid-binding protein
VILIDTGPLVALCRRRDTHHRRAVEHLQSLANNQFAVCEAVVVEACFHLLHRAERRRLAALLHAVQVAWLLPALGADYRRHVFEWLIKYADHQPDWADACIAVLSGYDTKVMVWTYDREFRTIWRRPDGTRIPMAINQ